MLWAPDRSQSKLTFHMELEILSIQSEQTTAATKRRHRCPLVSAVHAKCLQTGNLLFVKVIHLGLQNQKRLMHAINDWLAVDTCTHCLVARWQLLVVRYDLVCWCLGMIVSWCLQAQHTANLHAASFPQVSKQAEQEKSPSRQDTRQQ